MSQVMVAAIAEPVEGEVSLAYEVEVRAIGPVALLSDDGRTVLQELMDRAKSAALDVLDGAAPVTPLPASLAAGIANTIRCWDAWLKAERLWHGRLPGQRGNDELPDPTAAHNRFDEAFIALKTRFEQEFPHHG